MPHRARRLAACSLILVLAILGAPGAGSAAAATPTAAAPANCPVTPYTVGTPDAPQTTVSSGASFTLTWYGNQDLWAGLDRAYRGQWYAAPAGIKVLWVRLAPGRLTVEGHRLDGAAPPLRADIPQGYGDAGIQASGLVFPTPGCWQVTGRVPGHALQFVVAVHPAAENPVTGGVPAAGPDAWASIRRPLHLPIYGPDAGRTCPGTPGRTVTPALGPAVGEEPAYAAGFGAGGSADITNAREDGGWFYVKTLWLASPAYNGPLLIRGAQLDGTNVLRFGDGPDPGYELRLPPGGTAAPANPAGTPSAASGWSSWPSSTRVQEPGCYAFQVDGWSFSEIIVVPVRGGGSGTPA